MRSREKSQGSGQISTRRLKATKGIVGFCVVLLAAQLIHVTVFPDHRYVALAKAEGSATVAVQAPRGAILDRNGNQLAVSIPKKTIIADPAVVVDPLKEATLLAQVLGESAAKIRPALLVAGQFSYVQHLITSSQATTIQGLINQGALPGISLTTEMTRYDPNGTLAQPVIGTLGPSGNPLSGLEYEFRNLLDGTAGQKVVSVSETGNPLPVGVSQLVPPKPGDNLVLGLDKAIQFNAEQTLGAEIVKSQALSGSAIIMDPQNGQIIAMANLVGTSSPAKAPMTGSSPGHRVITGFAQAPTNMAVTNVYEPGSVAKIATFADALRKGVITPSSTVVVPPFLKIAGSIFHDAEVHGTEILSPEQILAQSSNIGTIIIAQHLNKYSITNSFLNFGWGKSTGLGFPGETSGFLVNPSKWSGTAIGSVPIGQDEAVSALQVLDSYNAIANDGTLITPHFVDQIVPQNGKPAYPYKTTSRRVLTPAIALTMQQLLSGTVSANGTAPLAQVPGYQILGKTGTAQIPYPNKPGYQPGAFMATFVGFTHGTATPLSAIVVLEHPNPIYGGSVAAPVFSKIMSYALKELAIPPGNTGSPLAFLIGPNRVLAGTATFAGGQAPMAAVFGSATESASVTIDRFRRAKGSV